MESDDDVRALFRTRTEAVKKRDRPLFLSTQVSEIYLGSSEGYLSLEDMTTEVLYVHEESELERVALVKETYKRPDKDRHSSFLTYFLTHTTKGWRVYGIR